MVTKVKGMGNNTESATSVSRNKYEQSTVANQIEKNNGRLGVYNRISWWGLHGNRRHTAGLSFNLQKAWTSNHGSRAKLACAEVPDDEAKPDGGNGFSSGGCSSGGGGVITRDFADASGI
jgi:hypothetical protein